LYGKLGRLCLAGWKCPGKPANLFLRDGGKKLNAGQPGSGEQLGKLFLNRSAFQRNAIQQQLGTGGSEHQPVLRSHGNRFPQFAPCDIQLFDGTGVLETVQTGKLQEYVEASYEGSSRSRLDVRYHALPRHPCTRTT
jgi:hypothetical protein